MQASKNAPYLENEHNAPPFFCLLGKVDHYTFLRRNLKKNRYVGTFWVGKSLINPFTPKSDTYRFYSV